MPFANLNSAPEPSETITRYIFERSHFAPNNARVKPKALEPAADKLASVFRIIGLTNEKIWELGTEFVEPLRGRPSLARADILISNVNRLELQVNQSEPPPRHADIAGWSDEKDFNMSKAQVLAADAHLVVRNIQPPHV